jgi:hypothetical protein
LGLGLGLGGGAMLFALSFAIGRYVHRAVNADDAVAAPVEAVDAPDVASKNEPKSLRGEEVLEEASV